jgi:hypothetical protein
MAWLFGRKTIQTDEAFDPDPGITNEMPARPYRVLHADLPLYSDPECKMKVKDASLIVLKSEDPKQQFAVQECMPTRKKYQIGQLVRWDLNNKEMWQNCWYKDPDSGSITMAWVQAVEFIGKIVESGRSNPSLNT